MKFNLRSCSLLVILVAVPVLFGGASSGADSESNVDEARGTMKDQRSFRIGRPGASEQSRTSASSSDSCATVLEWKYPNLSGQFALWLDSQIHPSLCPVVMCMRSCQSTQLSCRALNTSSIREFLLLGAESNCCNSDASSGTGSESACCTE